MHIQAASSESVTPFHDLVLLSPDFLMVLAIAFLRHMDAPTFSALLGPNLGRGGEEGDEGSVPVATDTNMSEQQVCFHFVFLFYVHFKFIM